MVDIKLKPCPFCGGEAICHEKNIPKIQCSKCRAKIDGARFRMFPRNYTYYLASLWNRRQPNEEPENL